MFKTIIIMFKGIASVVRRVDVDAFHLPCELLLKSLQRKKVVSVDEHVVEDVLAILPARGGMMRFFHILHQHARLKARSLVFPDPSQFKLL